MPKTLGRYQVLKHLASGGMAEVLLARARANDGTYHYVVIKRIRGEQARDHRFVRMFLDEAQLAAALYHPNIVRVFEIGEEQGEYFFAMEYVHGEDLRKVLIEIHRRNDLLPIAQVLGIMHAVASGLHHAHEALGPMGTPLGLVHRDVSPANILVGYDGSVKVADFGIAKATLHTAETRSGTLKGKVAYMSPEQVMGRPIDRRSDLFAMGIVFYETVTARRLFKGDNDFLTMSAIVQGDIPPPSQQRADVPRPLEEIIMQALATNPSDRFQSAAELVAALDRFSRATGLRTSNAGIADYMKKLFGHRPEPWLVDEVAAETPSIDFDGSNTGVVAAPEAAAQRFALPRRVGATAPIVMAHNEATGQSYTPAPMEAPPLRNPRARTEAVAALGYGHTMPETEEVELAPNRSWLVRGGVAIGAIAVIAIVIAITSRSGKPTTPAPAAVAHDVETKPAEQRPAEQLPVETKPAEQTAEAKAAETAATQTTAAQARAAEITAAQTTAEAKAAEAKAAAAKAAEAKAAAVDAAEAKAAENQAAQARAAEAKAAEKQAAEARAAEKTAAAAEVKAAEKQAAEARAAEKTAAAAEAKAGAAKAAAARAADTAAEVAKAPDPKKRHRPRPPKDKKAGGWDPNSLFPK